jgi:ribonuclease T
MNKRFRGFLPAVIDIETAGFNYQQDAILEIATVLLEMDEQGDIHPGETHSFHVQPFEGANLDREALEFTGIDPFHPFRFAVTEKEALEKTFTAVNAAIKKHKCQRAVLVGHNPMFDISFLLAAIKRVKIANPFHKFTTFDTATLGGLSYGQTVLARACKAAGIKFDVKQAHSAIYDAERTAELFCKIVNSNCLFCKTT